MLFVGCLRVSESPYSVCVVTGYDSVSNLLVSNLLVSNLLASNLLVSNLLVSNLLVIAHGINSREQLAHTIPNVDKCKQAGHFKIGYLQTSLSSRAAPHY